MTNTSERGEVATILAISAIVVIGISMISSVFFGGKKQSTSSKANENCILYQGERCSDYPSGGLCGEGKTCSDSLNGAQCCPVTAQTAPTTAPTSTDPCGGNNGACKDNCGSGNDCVKYLESVTVPGLTDGSVITTDSFSCDIVTKNVYGGNTDKDNICGVKVNDQWPAWCPWDGVGQYMCGATITSRANCDLKSSHFSSTPVKAGDKLQVVAARKTGSCGNIPWNTGGNFITGPTFYYKQKGGGSTNTTPQATTVPQTPRATTAPQQPQPTTTSQTGNTTPKPTEQVGPGGTTPVKNSSITPTTTTSSPTSGPTTSQTPPTPSPTQTPSSSITPTQSVVPPSTPSPTAPPTPTYSTSNEDFNKKGDVLLKIKLKNLGGRDITDELSYFTCNVTPLIDMPNPKCNMRISGEFIEAVIGNIHRFSNFKQLEYTINLVYRGRPTVNQKDIISEKITFRGDEFYKSFIGEVDFSLIKKNISIQIKNSSCISGLIIPKNSVKMPTFGFVFPNKEIKINKGNTEDIASTGVDTDLNLGVQIEGGVCINESGGKSINTTVTPTVQGNNYSFLFDI